MEENQHLPAPDEEYSEPPVEEGAPSWTVTFGDMMSLLLTFFILLFSMSEIKMERFLLASQSLREAMGGTATDTLEDPLGLMPEDADPDLMLQAPGSTETSETEEAVDADLLESFTKTYLDLIANRLQEFVEEEGLQETVSVDREDDGVYLRMETITLFGSGDALIAGAGREILEVLSRITMEFNVAVVVAGHADNQPIRSSVYPSNWELSAARAAGVARFLVEDGHTPTMVRVESYGEFRPIADNGTPEGRAKNRRVELLFTRDDVMAAAINWTRGSSETDEGNGEDQGTREGSGGEDGPAEDTDGAGEGG
jgi:chemotaxis protein MotB